MRVLKIALASLLWIAVTAPASAQLFFKPPDFSGPPIFGPEPGLGVPLPGATPDEQTAAVVWDMRSALNLAGLQCGFEPTLRTAENYNAMLFNHRDELAASYAKLTSYFTRTNKTVKAAQAALDKYGTRSISGFSSVGGQLGFCHVASRVSLAAFTAPPGTLASVAQTRLRELYNAQRPRGDLQFSSFIRRGTFPQPRFDKDCWDKKDNYRRECGNLYPPPVE